MGIRQFSMTVILCEVAVDSHLQQSVRWSRLVAKSLVSDPGCCVQIHTLLLPGSVTMDKELNLSVLSVS